MSDSAERSYSLESNPEAPKVNLQCPALAATPPERRPAISSMRREAASAALQT